MLTPGTLLGERYEIIEKIGAGGMSTVYKAKDNRLQRYVAIKELREEFVQDDEFVSKFRKEALSAASLSHPNIVGIYDVGSDHERHYIVMEYVEGQTLKQVIAEKGPFDAKTVLELGIQMVSALKHAHSKKIIHRDIKPQNILMTNDGTLKVTDFGIAKAVDSSTIVASGNAIGSVHYFSPEQAKGKFVNESSDLYSCGIVLFELATKRLPFEADSHISIALKHINEELPKPSSINPQIPENLENLILKATSKNQVDRYQNADEMLRDMRGILQDPNYVVKNNKLVERTILLSAEETQLLRDKGNDMIYKRDNLEEKDEQASIYDEEVSFNNHSNASNDDEVPTLYKVLISIAGVLATLAIVVVISLAVVFGFKGSKYSVPNVVGKSLTEAQKMISSNKLKFEVVQVVDTTVEEGTVVDQNPKASTTLKKGGLVTLTVAVQGGEQEDTPTAEEESEVPDLTGLDTSDAQRAISEAGLSFGQVSFEYDENVESGLILSQDPKAGEKVPVKSKINVVISKGSEKESGVLVPSVVGMSLEEAQNELIASKLSVGQIREEYSDKYNAGIVIRQGVGSGANVEEGTRVDLTVSKGKQEEQPVEPEQPDEPEEPTLPTEPDVPVEEPAQPVTIQRSIDKPLGVEVKDSYHLFVRLKLDNGETQVICDENVSNDSFPYAISLTGTGTGILEVYIDDQNYQEQISF